MGDERSLGAVASQLGKTKSLIARWSSQHKWTERVNAHLRPGAKFLRYNSAASANTVAIAGLRHM